MSAITQIVAAMSKCFRFFQGNRDVARCASLRLAPRMHFTRRKDSRKGKVVPAKQGFLRLLILLNLCKKKLEPSGSAESRDQGDDLGYHFEHVDAIFAYSAKDLMMSLLWYWRYIPCAGVKLEFDEFDLYEKDERTIVYLTRRDPKQRRKIFQKHIQEDDDRLFKNVGEIDFEIALTSISGDGVFHLDYAHVFTFLLMIRTGGWISAPVILTHSVLNDPEIDAPYIYCSNFVDAKPASLGEFRLTLEDAQWIKLYMEAALRFIDKPKFQNAMQALTSFHCIPYPSRRLLVAWSGLEALFGVDQEISFRLSLYISNFLKSDVDRYVEFEKLRRSYDDRSRVAHGAATRAKAVDDYAAYTRDILRRCLVKCIETGAFPNPRELIF